MIKKIMQFWFNLPQILRFILVGGANAVFAYIVFCIYVYIIGENYRQLCLIMQWISTSFICYLMQRIFVFQSNGKIWNEYIKCCITWSGGYLINALSLELFYQIGLNVYISQLLAQILAAILSYILFKYWALRRKKN